ncbi:hypothetical protein ACJJTC_018582 [Scirpophaga incertulas]
MYVLYDNFNLWLVASVFVGAIARLTDDPRGLNGTVEGVNKYYHASSLRLCNHIIDQSDIHVPIERTQVSGYREPLFQPENNNTEFENIEEKGQIDDLVLNRDLNYKENIDTHNENVIHRESDISNGSRPELRQIGNDPIILCEKPSSSTDQILTERSLLETEIVSSTKTYLLKDISPLPKATPTGKSRVRNRKVGGSQVITSSPFMNDIKAAVQEKKKENHKSLKQQKQKKRVLFENDETAPKRSKSRRGQKSKISALCDDVVNHEESDDVGAGPSFKRSTRGRKQTKRVIFDDDEDLDDPYANKDCEEDDPACIYCNELFSQSRPKEHWVKCQLCSNWCHTLCAGIPARKKQFICELCS